jgi:signal transduction histidine kinase
VGLVSFVTTRLRENSMHSRSVFLENSGSGGAVAPCPQDISFDARDEELLAERTRIAQELHDTLLQGFLAVSMHLQLAVDRLPAGSPEKQQFGDVLRLMDSALTQGRCAVEGLRSPVRQLASLGEAFAGVPADLCLPTSVDFRVVVYGKERELKASLFDELYRIGREAIFNAYRHSQAKLIEAEIEYRSTELRIAVRDDGCGIDADELHRKWNGHWGLRGMRDGNRD